MALLGLEADFLVPVTELQKFQNQGNEIPEQNSLPD